eukprot:4931626-Lingulodinium_polyedra.AAC.1
MAKHALTTSWLKPLLARRSLQKAVATWSEANMASQELKHCCIHPRMACFMAGSGWQTRTKQPGNPR